MIDPSKLWLTSSEEYHASLAQDSHSSLELFRKSREAYAAQRVFKTMWPDAPTPPMILGSLLHCFVLETKAVGDRYIVHPGFDRRTREGKAQAETFTKLAAGKTIVTMDDTKLVSAMREGIMRNPHARRAIEDDGVSEAAITWECPETGCALKCRMDRLHPAPLIIDIKTCEDVSPDGWARSVFAYGYHKQAALYMDGLKTVMEVDCPFLFIAVSKSPPHEAVCYLLDDRAITLGREENLRTLRELATCRASGDWSGRWSNEVQNLSLPAWAYSRNQP